MLRRWIGLTVLIASRICAASAIALSRILNKVWMAKPFDPRPLMAGVKKRFLLSEERFTFVVFGDTELKPGSERVFHFAEQLAPDFMIHLGDLVHRGADVLTRDWDLLAEQHGRLFRRIPFWPVIGNHEFRGNLKWANGSRFKQFFGLF
ncbi:MAG TPA: metallophosphoesterase family protein [bacterium]|nr:metallophosphoesterase family protein [bacterium]